MSGGDHRVPQDRAEGRLSPFATVLTAVIGAFEWSGKIIAFAMIAFTFGTLLINVILRYAFGSGIAWAYEIHAITLPWLVAGGMVVATARARNITVTLLPDMLSPTMARQLLVAVNLAVVAIAVTVVWSSQPILRASTFQSYSTRTLADLGLKQVWGYASLIYAFASMATIAALDAVRVALSPPPGRSDPARTSTS
jgi:TRAP-type transport system small permease protein